MEDDRLSRIEAHLAIQQLAVSYAMAVDSRDLELLAEQWVPDVWMGKANGQGRDAVKRYFRPILEGFYRTMHMIVGHRIELIDSERATGQVYCRAEHESGEQWIVEAIVYDDTYRCVEGTWGFAKRVHHHWYATPIEVPPRGPTFQDWPGGPGPTRPDLPHLWPSWERFWAATDPATLARVTRHPSPSDA